MPNKKKSSLHDGKTNKKRKATSPLQDTEQCTGVTRAKTSQTGSTSIQNKHKQTRVATVSEPKSKTNNLTISDHRQICLVPLSRALQ